MLPSEIPKLVRDEPLYQTTQGMMRMDPSFRYICSIFNLDVCIYEGALGPEICIVEADEEGYHGTMALSTVKSILLENYIGEDGTRVPLEDSRWLRSKFTLCIFVALALEAGS